MPLPPSDLQAGAPFSYAQFVSDGSTVLYSIPFEYLSRDHVSVYAGDAEAAFTFASDTQVTLDAAPANGVVVTIQRNTPHEAPITILADPGTLRADTLNALHQQSLYVMQEAADLAADAAPASEAALASQVAAAASEAAADTSADSAAASATAAAGSATSAANSATAASTSATNAANSATAASTSATNAATSATAAETAEGAAAASATAADTSEANAAASATAADTSEANAAASASAASTSEANAAASATSAANSATAAATSETNAATSAAEAAASAASVSNPVSANLYDANTILKADADNTPAALTVAASRLVGRAAAGSIDALTGTQATALLDVVTSGAKGLAPASGGGTVNFLRADGTWTTPPPVVGAGLQQEGLVVTNGGTPTTQVTVTADALIVYSTTGVAERLTSVNVTADITASGANGLDTGTEAADTWYHVWVIHNPSGPTTAALLSASSTAPTMPSGYTHKQRVGAVRNNASSNFLLFRQIGRNLRCEERVLIQDGSLTTGAWTALGVTSFFPPTASTISFGFGTTGGNLAMSHRSDGFGGEYFYAGAGSSATTLGSVFPTNRAQYASNRVLYAATVYYLVTNAGSTLLATGWEF